MGSAGEDTAARIKQRTKIFAVLTYLSLATMALFSSLGESFIYIFAGAALFFAMMAAKGWWRLNGLHASGAGKSTTWSSRTRISDALFSMFNKHRRYTSGSSPDTTYAQKVKMIVAAISIALVIVTIGFIVLTIGNADSSDESLSLKLLGDEYYYKGSYDSAASFYYSAIKSDESFADAYYSLGNLKLDLQQYDSAIHYYSRALQYDPSSLDAVYGKALAHFSIGEYSNSLRELRRILAENDGYENAYLLAGDNFYVQKEYDSAMFYYVPAYERGVRSKELLNIMGYIYDVRGNQNEAISFYKQTLEYDSTVAEVNKRLGELLPGPDGDYFRRRAAE